MPPQANDEIKKQRAPKDTKNDTRNQTPELINRKLSKDLQIEKP